MSKENMPQTSTGEMKFTWEDGRELRFEHFEPKETNLIKIRLAFDPNDMHEGIWACISDEDMKDYDNDVEDAEYKRVAILRNSSLTGPPWGAYIPYKMDGDNRPVSYLEGLNCDMFFNMAETV